MPPGDTRDLEAGGSSSFGKVSPLVPTAFLTALFVVAATYAYDVTKPETKSGQSMRATETMAASACNLAKEAYLSYENNGPRSPSEAHLRNEAIQFLSLHCD